MPDVTHCRIYQDLARADGWRVHVWKVRSDTAMQPLTLVAQAVMGGQFDLPLFMPIATREELREFLQPIVDEAARLGIRASKQRRPST